MLKQYRLKNYHFQLVVYIIALSIIGILLIGSAKHSVQSKQIIGFVMGLTIMIVLSLIDYSFLLKFVWIYYAVMIVLLLLVLFAGDDAKGAQRWFKIAGIRFQPSEIAKIILILFFAYFFSRFEDSINTVRTLALSAIFAGIPLFLILKQPDNSTTILTALIFATLLFISGLSYKNAGTWSFSTDSFDSDKLYIYTCRCTHQKRLLPCCAYHVVARPDKLR